MPPGSVTFRMFASFMMAVTLRNSEKYMFFSFDLKRIFIRPSVEVKVFKYLDQISRLTNMCSNPFCIFLSGGSTGLRF